MYYIYKIENLINHKKYIGLTNNLSRRKARHFTDLYCERHDNSFLQKEFKQYGKENFSFEKIFEGDIDYKQISEKEKEYIKYYDSYWNGYNQNEGGNFGPSNGGSHLTKTDVLNILAATEFMKRPGTILGTMFEVSNTTIMRVKNGTNHCEIYEEYWKMDEKNRKEIFNIFCEANDLNKKLEESHSLKTQRKLNKQQVFMILANYDQKKRIITQKQIAKDFNVKSTYTIKLIEQRKTYKDWCLEYDSLSDEAKQKIVTLLREK